MKTTKQFSKLILLLLFSVIALQSCDPITTYETYVDNRSADTLTIHFSQNDSARFGTSGFTVMPGELLQVFFSEEIGKNKNYECEVFDAATTLSAPGGKMVTKDASDISNWTSIYANELLRWQCFFQVKDADIQ